MSWQIRKVSNNRNTEIRTRHFVRISQRSREPGKKNQVKHNFCSGRGLITAIFLLKKSKHKSHT